MAYVNLLRASVGVGILGAPIVISQAGLLVGPVLSAMIGALLVHTHLMLLWCLNEICRQLKISSISYRYGFRLALLHGPPIMHCLGNYGPFVIAVFMILSQLGISSVQIIFIADNIQDMMDWASSEKSLLCMMIPILLLEISLRNLRKISIVVMGANVLNLAALGLVTFQICRGPRRDTQLAPLTWTSVLVAVGTLFFNLSAVGVILSCEKALSDPKLMQGKTGVVVVGMMVPSFVTILVGSLGYWTLGVMDANVLRYLPLDEIVTSIALGLYTVTAGLAYPLACYPATQIISEVIKNHDHRVLLETRTMKAVEFVSRPIFVMVTFLMAYLFPFQTPYVSFVGCLCTTLVSIVFPALMEIGLCYPEHYGRYNYILVKDLLLVVFGLVIFGTGFNLCGKLMINRLLAKESPINENYVDLAQEILLL